MPIYHRITPTTCNEPTLLDEYQSNTKPSIDKDKENEIYLQWMPDINSIIDPDNETRGKLASKWSVNKTNILFREYQRLDNKNNWRGGSNIKIGLSKLVNIVNESYGIDNWMSKVESSRIINYNEEKLEVKSVVTVILADNTIVQEEGIGIGMNLPREMMFRKCKKESVSDALRKCIVRLVALLLDYEDKVRSGYYPKYR